jgi:hypothetical protein
MRAHIAGRNRPTLACSSLAGQGHESKLEAGIGQTWHVLARQGEAMFDASIEASTHSP